MCQLWHLGRLRVKNLFFKALCTCAYEMGRMVKKSKFGKRTFFWVSDVLQKNREIKNPQIG